MSHKQNNILDLIGGTPLVPIGRMNPNPRVEILAKLEFFNPGGSVKDRPALYMIEEAERKGELTKGKIIVEATSGNTGIGLALVAAVKGYPVLLCMSESVSEERVKILKALGADIEFTPAHLGTDGAIELVYKLVREEPEKYWLADQFNSEANWRAHYHGTAPEIWEQTGGELSAIVVALGTTGTVMGISRRFKELDPEVNIIGVEPYLGHKIQGLKNMKESYQPGIFEKKRLDRIVHIDDEEAFQTARLLAKQEGIFAGMSSGAAMAAALRLSKEMQEGRIVVILPDGGDRYLSTPLFAAKRKSGLRLYNTLSRKKEEFIPLVENEVTMYSCGPTLCHLIHVGQWRRFLFTDLLRRYLEFKGYQVKLVMNLTDLDDRTIEGAEKAGKSLKIFTDQYHRSFMEDLQKLRIKEAAAFPRASEHVEDMIGLTRKLLEKGYAYEKFHSVYFDISRFKEYGSLSRIDLNKIKLGKTVDLDQYEKDNPRDFTLFKRSTLNELKKGIFYQTQWGNVRPSWHTECSAMAAKYLGASYDIHTSSVDLIFPHHENSIAISEALTGKSLAKYWVHNELVMVNGKKASRLSTSDLMTLSDLEGLGYTPREVRYWLLSRHYRKPIFFARQKLDTAKNTIAHLDKFVQKVHACSGGISEPDIDQMIYDLKHKFTESMDDDLNVAPALAALFDFVHRVNETLDRRGLSESGREKVLKALGEVDAVMGVLDLEPASLSEHAAALLEKRERAREMKDWGTADRLRLQLRDLGIEITDTKDGPVWRRLPLSAAPKEE